MMENPKNRSWKVLTSEYLARKPWFTVRHESLELRDGRFVLIDQYRHGLGETSYEIPAGVTEPSDASPLAAAQRELMEETGYGGGQWRLLTTLSANPATQNNLTHCYLATGVEPLGEQHLDPTEDLRVHLMTREEVLELLRTDRIRQALMAAPLWRYFCENKA